ncbi:MAG: MFS transporter [Defluviitaleaceae bacterium]|nr:MFS transporter [Defluviitaleaceae bacterium]
MEHKGPAKLWGFEFIFLLVVSFVNMGAFGMGIPIFPGYAVSLGATLSAAGAVTGMFSVVALIGRPFASIMGDRLNKKHLLIGSLVLNGFFTFLYVFVPGLGWLIPIRFIHGLMFSVSGTVSFAIGNL